MLWRFSKIKTLEVREISAPTITWKLEVGIATVFSTVLTLSPTLWWFDYMWQVWFLAIKLHTSAISISLSLLFFHHVSIWGQKWEWWEKARRWGAFPLALRSQLVTWPSQQPHVTWDLQQTSHKVYLFFFSQPSPSPVLLGCQELAWTSRTSQRGN